MLARIGRKVLRDSLKQKPNQHLLDVTHFNQTLRCISSKTPINTVFLFVPQQEAWVVERMGKFHRILDPGLNFLIPVVESVKYVQCLKEIAIEIPKRSAITSDNVTLDIDGVLFLKVNDPYKASYGIEDPEFAMTQLAQTTMRSELGKISLDDIFQKKETLSDDIIKSINNASADWGITCIRYEIRNIQLPTGVQEAMKLQAEAERKTRAAILEAEGRKTAEINIAEGKRAAKIIESEAEKIEMINRANGEAAALCAIAEARAKSIELIANVLKNEAGSNAAALSVAQQYVSAFDKLAKTNNTLIVPSNVGDISQAIVQALSIYNKIVETTKPENESDKIKKTTT